MSRAIMQACDNLTLKLSRDPIQPVQNSASRFKLQLEVAKDSHFARSCNPNKFSLSATLGPELSEGPSKDHLVRLPTSFRCSSFASKFTSQTHPAVMEPESDFGRVFANNFRRRMRQNLSVENQSSRPPSRSPFRERSKYNYFYTKNNRANILNVIAFVSDEVTLVKRISVEREIPFHDAQFIERGTTMEVHSLVWRKPKENHETRVAVKRVSRAYAPVRDKSLYIGTDRLYLTGREIFYKKVEDMMQEIKIMARVPIQLPALFCTSFSRCLRNHYVTMKHLSA